MKQQHKTLWQDIILAGIAAKMPYSDAKKYADQAVADLVELEAGYGLPWHEAPEWAEWAAYDKYDCWYWYETKPEIVGDGEWNNVGDAEDFQHTPFPGDWKDSLQRRPG